MIRFCTEAATEIEDAVDWYLAKSPDAAERFHRAITKLLFEIESDPTRFPNLHLDFQYGRVIGFPYICIFHTQPQYIRILAIAHTSRNDRYWINRK
jgi:plasmid stabilization system protein ParE